MRNVCKTELCSSLRVMFAEATGSTNRLFLSITDWQQFDATFHRFQPVLRFSTRQTASTSTTRRSHTGVRRATVTRGCQVDVWGTDAGLTQLQFAQVGCSPSGLIAWSPGKLLTVGAAWSHPLALKNDVTSNGHHDVMIFLFSLQRRRKGCL